MEVPKGFVGVEDEGKRSEYLAELDGGGHREGEEVMQIGVAKVRYKVWR